MPNPLVIWTREPIIRKVVGERVQPRCWSCWSLCFQRFLESHFKLEGLLSWGFQKFLWTSSLYVFLDFFPLFLIKSFLWGLLVGCSECGKCQGGHLLQNFSWLVEALGCFQDSASTSPAQLRETQTFEAKQQWKGAYWKLKSLANSSLQFSFTQVHIKSKINVVSTSFSKLHIQIPLYACWK